MSERYPGGFIVQNPTAPTTAAAPGIWTLEQATQYIQAGTWPLARDEFFENVTLLLPGNGTNGAQNNTFLDSSTNNFTITRNGNTTQGTFSPYGNLWSNYFDGVGDYLEVADNAALDLSGDFTIECWVNWQKRSGATFPRIISKGDFQTSTSAWIIAITESSGGLSFTYGNPSATVGGGAVTEGTWNHIAVTRSGTTLRTFLNGVLQATATVATDFSSTNPVRIGAGSLLTSNEQWNGYISNARIIKGTAVYTANFTPPTAPLTAITNTSLLTCQSNRFIDASSNNFAITRNGDVSVQHFTPFSPTAPYAASVDGGSGYFDGSGDYLTYPSNAALQMGTGQFWFEAWIWMPSAPSTQYIVLGTNSGSLTSNALTVRIQPSALRVDRHGIVAYDSSAVTWQYRAWQHIAVGRDSGNTLRFFVNGVAVGTRASTTDNFAGDSNAIGLIPIDNQPGTAFNGYITDARLLKGTCLQTASFTPPSAPLTPITNTSLLLNFTNAGIIDNAMMNDLETVGNAQISTSVSKFGGGSLYFDGNGDYLSAPSSNLVDFGTGDFTIECWVYWVSQTNNFQGIVAAAATSYAAGANTFLGFGTGSSVGVGDRGRIALGGFALDNASATVRTNVLSLNTWYHVAATRSGNTIRIFQDGVLIDQKTYTGSYGFAAFSTFRIGSNLWDGSAGFFNGYIDDLRITKGVARYTASFTVPNAAFPTL